MRNNRQTRLRSCSVKGFRSLRDVTINFDGVNVLIGANGSGKSNLLGMFRMLSAIMNSGLQEYVGLHGRATSVLHYGPKKTSQIEIEVRFEGEKGENSYACTLAHADPDTLIFTKEHATFQNPSVGPGKQEILMGAGHPESKLPEKAKENKTAGVVLSMLLRCRPYQFHDTAGTSAIRNACYVNDNRALRWDGGNLAAVLKRLQDKRPAYYSRIVDRIALIAPFFRGFSLDVPESPAGKGAHLLLDWHDHEHESSGYRFGPHQLSDGTLRAMALITLLLMPEDESPDVLMLDEPELGLHPYAIAVIADLIRAYGSDRQILVATQSPTLLQHFEADQIIVADRDRGETVFRRHSADSLREWLEDFSLPELWEKNVLGGRPSAWSA